MNIIYDTTTGLVVSRGATNLSRNVGAGQAVLEDVAFEAGKSNGDYFVEGGVMKKKNYITLSTDATDDAIPTVGVPDIPADGVSTATITIKKTKGETDGAMTATGDNDTVYIETTAGKLSTQSVDLVKGTANITLTSVAETIIAEVSVYGPNDVMCAATIQIQFA